mgnify:CR=1 FL=1|jgi:hypothetical protein
MNVKELLTQSDNQTLCAIRAMGFMGVGLVAVAIVIGAPAIEAGAAIAAIVTSVGGSIRLKGSD